jgi:hypothetical protein
MKSNIIGWAALAGLWQTTAAADSHRILRRNSQGLKNGNWTFESGKPAPWYGVSEGSQGTDRARVKIVSPGYNSNYAASLGPAPRGGVGTMAASITGNPNTNYTITAMYQVVEAASPDCKFSVGASDLYNNQNDQNTEVAMVVGDWTPISVVWPNFIDEYGQFGIDFTVNCPGKANSTVLIDNIELTATGTLEPSSCPGNADVVNGDFESGSIAPWQAANGESQLFGIVSPGDNSAHALQASFGPNTELGAAWWNNVNDVCFNYYYTYSFAVNWVNYSPLPTTTPEAGACSLGAVAYNCGNEDLFNNIWPAAEGWKQYTFNCTAQRDNVQFYFQLDCGPSAPSHSWAVQIDNVQLNYVGGPAPLPSNPGSGPTATPTPTPTPSAIAASSKKRAEELAKPRWT